MKANELRIGSFIKINNEIIEGIGYGVIIDLAQINKGLTNDYLKLLKHEPILLTEEWLLKFGFEKSEITGSIDSWQNFSISLNTYSKSKVDYFWLRYYQHNVCQNIKYVHHLQNLYFFLTGEELKLLGDGDVLLK